jgi:hypothetical protein
MNTEAFVKWLGHDEIEQGIAEYQQLLDETELADATDPFWQQMLGLYRRLPKADQATLIAVIRQARIDATARMLAIIDGDGPAELQLIDVDSGEALEDLADGFLEQMED